MKIRKVHSVRYDEWGFKADFSLGGRKVTLPTDGVYASTEQAREGVKNARTLHAKGQFIFPADRKLVTVGTIFEAWLKKQREEPRSPKHIRLAERTFEIFGRNILARDSSLDVLTVAHLEAYFLLRRKQGAAPQTAAKELKQVSAALKNARRIKGLEAWTPPAKPEGLEPGEPEEKRAITRQEEHFILADLEADPRLKDRIQLGHMLVIGIHTGLRVSEIFRISREDIRDEPAPGEPHGALIAHTTKTAKFGKVKKRTMRMSTKVRKILDERRAWDPLTSSMPLTGALFPRFDYIKEFKLCCARAGVRYGPEGITFHSSRHTFVTRQREQGTRLEVIQKLTGQKTMAVTRGYSHVTAEEVGEAMAYLDDEEE